MHNITDYNFLCIFYNVSECSYELVLLSSPIKTFKHSYIVGYYHLNIQVTSNNILTDFKIYQNAAEKVSFQKVLIQFRGLCLLLMNEASPAEQH